MSDTPNPPPAASTLGLLRLRRFLPLFAVQFLGALNDNLFKNAMAILVVYRLGETTALPGHVLVTVAAGVFILPFFLFSATAGQVADRMEKSRLVRAVKLAELLIALAGVWALLAADAWAMLGVLFLLGVQSAVFGPVKYALLPEHLREDELVGGNALFEAGTFVAILLGTLAGGLLVLRDGGPVMVAGGLVVVAAAGLVAALLVPPARAGDAGVRVGLNPVRETAAVIAALRGNRVLLLSVLGISWFWFVGATYLAQFPAFAKDVLGGDETLVTLMLTLFALGIGLGSMLCARLLKGEVSARYVPLAALGIALFSFDLYAAAGSLAPPAAGAPPLALSDALARPGVWRVLVDLGLLAVCGGLYIVPLYAILQARSEAGERSRMIAANNILNAAFMVASAALAAGLLALGAGVGGVFLVTACLTLAVTVYICGLLPDALIKGGLRWLLRLAFRVRTEGLEHLPPAGARAVVVVNHVSFLDAVLLAAFLPGRPTFAINTQIAGRWWVRPFLGVVDALAVDPANPMATKTLIARVREGRTLVIFPEGRITVTGSLMKVYDGPGMIADKADAPIIPVRIDGAQFSLFSRLKGKVRRTPFPAVAMTVLPPRRLAVGAEVVGRARRRAAARALYDLMAEMMFATSDYRLTLFDALTRAAALHGGDRVVAEDIARTPLTYNRLLTGALALGRRLAAEAPAGGAVGLLLPNSLAAVVSFCGLQAYGRVPAMLNFSTGAEALLAACTAAEVQVVVTARRFLDQARLWPLAEALQAGGRTVLILEDLRAEIGLWARLRALASRPFARLIHARCGRTPDDPAVILFTSGSEGTPKGVVLSHANILANGRQLAARVDFTPTDVVFNALPVFHSFGLTAGLILPLMAGIRTFLYPSPLHYRIIPELVYDTNATILFGTDTFLAGYARVANPYDFYSVRYVFAGAEKVKDETRRVWMDTFGLRLLEGYGATETAPVLAVNTPMHFRAGSVGRLLPGIAARIEPVPGITHGGRLVVSGPNVMLGYLRAEAPGVLQPLADGWYDTSDIVTIDPEGYVRIEGRVKRFAKVAGEMVPLGRVESELAALWPDAAHAVVAVPDARKGEQLVLMTTRADTTRAAVLDGLRAAGLAEIMIPRAVIVLDRLPVLGTGKTDYVALQSRAASEVAP